MMQIRYAMHGEMLPAVSDALIAAGIPLVVLGLGALFFTQVQDRFVYYV
jgi:ABC-type polysaccharide/polyol phosphate export permease